MLSIDRILKNTMSNRRSHTLSISPKTTPLMSLGRPHQGFTNQSFNFNRMFKPISTGNYGLQAHNNVRGAGLKMQMQWKQMPVTQRAVNKILFKDSDKDGVPNRWDCQMFNKSKQESRRVFFHAGNVSPSQDIKNKGLTFGFVDKNIADGYRKIRNYNNVYEYESENYKPDTTIYSRKSSIQKNPVMKLGNEFISKDVIKEKQIIGASIQKQQDWKKMPKEEKVVEQITQSDIDRDGTPNSFDCEPNNPDKQDSVNYYNVNTSPQLGIPQIAQYDRKRTRGGYYG